MHPFLRGDSCCFNRTLIPEYQGKNCGASLTWVNTVVYCVNTMLLIYIPIRKNTIAWCSGVEHVKCACTYLPIDQTSETLSSLFVGHSKVVRSFGALHCVFLFSPVGGLAPLLTVGVVCFDLVDDIVIKYISWVPYCRNRFNKQSFQACKFGVAHTKLFWKVKRQKEWQPTFPRLGTQFDDRLQETLTWTDMS